MRQIFAFVLIIIYSSLSLAHQEKSGKELLQWLSSMPRHGIEVSADHWLAIAEGQSESKALEIVQLYSKYLDRGRLDKRYFQPGWTIPSQPQYSSPHPDIPQIEDIQPDIPEYQYLIKALNNLKLWNKSAYQIFPNDLVLFKGDIHPAVSLLNQWLIALDLAEELPDHIYSQEHKDVLTSIQLKYKLIPDGRLGPMTRQALLSITNQRIRTLKANLERIRWLPKKLPYPRVWVDIAGFTTSYQSSPQRTFYFKTIVGSPNKQTPVLKSDIENITINPVWKVPHSIASRSLLREEKKQPGFFRREGFKVYESWNDNSPEIAVDSVNWKALTQKSFTYRLEQQPGELNRLGKFKLGFKNSHGVYLHDTDKPELFDGANLSLSSGCARVNNIETLIETIALDQGLMHELNNFKKSNSTKKLNLNKHIPVYIVYFTAWPDKIGRVRFRDDIYQLDNALVSWF